MYDDSKHFIYMLLGIIIIVTLFTLAPIPMALLTLFALIAFNR